MTSVAQQGVGRVPRSIVFSLVLVLCLACPEESKSPLEISSQPDPASRLTRSGYRYTYDGNGNVATRTDHAGVVTRYIRDPLERVTAIEYSDGTSVSYRYDRAGRVIEMIDALGTTEYQYDIHDRLTGAIDSNGNRVQYEYGAKHRLKAITYPDGSRVSYGFDARDRLTLLKTPVGIYEYKYDGEGRPVVLSRPEGVRTLYEYDSGSRLTRTAHLNGEGVVLVGFEYRVDKAGNLVEAIREENGARRVSRFSYDENPRLIEARLPGGRIIEYRYDTRGRRISVQDSELGTILYRYDSRGLVSGVVHGASETRFEYDPNGNLAARIDPDGSRVLYSWDHENRLVRVVVDGDTIEFGRDGNGALIRVVAGGQITTYINDASGLLPFPVLGTCASPCTSIFCGLGQVGGMDQGGTGYDIFMDGLGSTIAESALGGEILSTRDFGPLGRPNGDPLTAASQVAGMEVLPGTDFAGGTFDLVTGVPIKDLRKDVSGIYDWAKSYVLDPFSDTLDVLETYPLIPDVLTPDRALTYVSRIDSLQEKLRVAKNVVKVIDLSTGVYRTYEAAEAGHNATAVAHMAKTLGDFGFKHVASVGASRVLASHLISAGGSTLGAALIPAAEAILVITTAALATETVSLASEVGVTHVKTWDVSRDRRRLINIGVDNLRARGANPGEIMDFLHRTGVDDGEMKRYLPPDLAGPCPPTCDGGPRGGGSGGDGPAVPLGGVALDRSAEFAVRIRDLKGASFDPVTGQLILVGHRDVALPQMNVDDLVVAIRAIYGGDEPSMSIEPCRPGTSDGCMKVHYDGHFLHPDLPEEGWVTYDASGRLTRSDHRPASFGSGFGWTIFEADRYLKTASLGLDNLERERPFQTQVEGYASIPERRRANAIRHGKVEEELDCLIRTVADHNRPSDCSRLWFMSGEVVVNTASDGKSASLEPVRIVTEARFVRHQRNGQMVDVPGEDSAVDDFVENFNLHYEDYAGEKKELAHLVQLAKIVALVRWIRENTALDRGWIERFRVQARETPTRTRATYAPSQPFRTADGSTHRVGIYGGVGFGPNIYRPDHTPTDNLARSAKRTRPSASDLSWEFDHQGKRFTAVALQLSPARVRGGYWHVRTDARESVSPALTAAVRFRYHSLDPRPSSYGRGWSLDVPSLSMRRVRVPDSDGFVTEAFIETGTGGVDVFSLTTEGVLRPTNRTSRFLLLGATANEDAMFTPIVLSGFRLLPGPWARARIENESGHPVAFGGFVAIRKDGRRIAFDPVGRIAAIQAPDGTELRYRYDPDGRLTEIADLRTSLVRFTYDDEDRLRHLDVRGRRARSYTYNNAGHLVQVSCADGERVAAYDYDEGGLLVGQVAAPKKTPGSVDPVSLSVTYDSIGRVVAFHDPAGGEWAVAYDDRNRERQVTNPFGVEMTRTFDDEDRLVAETDFAGRVRRFEYDSQGRVEKVTNGNGRSTSLRYDAGGNLSEISGPLDHVVRLLGYGPNGLPNMMVDQAGRVSLFEYDSRGRTKSVSTGYLASRVSGDGISYAPVDPITQTYEYDDAGDLVSIRQGEALR